MDEGSTVYIDGNPVDVGWGEYLGTGANCRKYNATLFAHMALKLYQLGRKNPNTKI